MLYKSTVVFVLLLAGGISFGQGCLENLYKAQKLLDEGKTDACLLLIRPCANKSNETSVRWQAYRLMSIAYIIKGQVDSSHFAAENMLEINPAYKPNILKDPKDFINVLNTIIIIPRFVLGVALSIGSNTTLPEITSSYVVSDYLKTYNAESSYQFGTNIGFYINPHMAIDIGLLATLKEYSMNYSFTDWMVNVDEHLTYLDIPFTTKYIFRPHNKLSYFAQGGVFGGYLLYSQNNFSANYVPKNETYSLSKLNSIERRNRMNLGITAGIGASYKMKQGNLSLQTNYYRSFSPIVKSDSRYNYSELIYTFFYIDDNIRLHNLALSIGYSFNINYTVYRKKK
jgi:hypothetical protein